MVESESWLVRVAQCIMQAVVFVALLNPGSFNRALAEVSSREDLKQFLNVEASLLLRLIFRPVPSISTIVEKVAIEVAPGRPTIVIV